MGRPASQGGAGHFYTSASPVVLVRYWATLTFEDGGAFSLLQFNRLSRRIGGRETKQVGLLDPTCSLSQGVNGTARTT